MKTSLPTRPFRCLSCGKESEMGWNRSYCNSACAQAAATKRQSIERDQVLSAAEVERRLETAVRMECAMPWERMEVQHGQA